MYPRFPSDTGVDTCSQFWGAHFRLSGSAYMVTTLALSITYPLVQVCLLPNMLFTVDFKQEGLACPSPAVGYPYALAE
jgi:hypothetical protein